MEKMKQRFIEIIENHSSGFGGVGGFLNKEEVEELTDELIQALSSQEVSDEDILNKASDWNFNEAEEFDGRKTGFIKGAKWMRSKVSSESEWISVEDRLPELNSRVLVYNGNEVFSYRYDRQEAFSESPNVTHWMHLPNPPKPLTNPSKQ